MEVKHEFLPYIQSLVINSLGFEGPHFGVIYSNEQIMTGTYGDFADIMKRKDSEATGAILYQQALEFFESKGYYVRVSPTYWYEGDERNGQFVALIYNTNDVTHITPEDPEDAIAGYKFIFINDEEDMEMLFKTKREAQLECIDRMIKLEHK